MARKRTAPHSTAAHRLTKDQAPLSTTKAVRAEIEELAAWLGLSSIEHAVGT